MDRKWRKSTFSNPSGNCVEIAEENDWSKSTFSGNNGSCVEFTRNGGNFLVRDSKDPNGPVLTFTPAEWDAFVKGAKDGQFDV